MSKRLAKTILIIGLIIILLLGGAFFYISNKTKNDIENGLNEFANNIKSQAFPNNNELREGLKINPFVCKGILHISCKSEASITHENDVIMEVKDIEIGFKNIGLNSLETYANAKIIPPKMLSDIGNIEIKTDSLLKILDQKQGIISTPSNVNINISGTKIHLNIDSDMQNESFVNESIFKLAKKLFDPNSSAEKLRIKSLELGVAFDNKTAYQRMAQIILSPSHMPNQTHLPNEGDKMPDAPNIMDNFDPSKYRDEVTEQSYVGAFFLTQIVDLTPGQIENLRDAYVKLMLGDTKELKIHTAPKEPKFYSPPTADSPEQNMSFLFDIAHYLSEDLTIKQIPF
ncbi:MAG: hypothetical protein E7K04_02715 [Helicobacter sp.]|nr:hypothetical protein [Helicobacter sp.]